MIPSSNFRLTHSEWVIVTFGSGSPAIKLFFLQLLSNVLLKHEDFIENSGFYRFHAYVTQQPQIWRLWHEVEWVDTVVTSLMSHSQRGFSAENWTQRDTQEVLEEHEQYHFMGRKHLTKTKVCSISSLPPSLRKSESHSIPWSNID